MLSMLKTWSKGHSKGIMLFSKGRVMAVIVESYILKEKGK